VEEDWAPADKIGVMTGGFDADLFKPMNLPRENDLLFIGTMSDRREKVANELIRSGYNVTIKKRLYGEDYVREMNRAKLIINVHMTENLDCETRLYESMATGTPILTEKLSDECEIFDIDQDKGMKVFDDVDHLKRLIDFYLENGEERERLGMLGYDEAINKHTWSHRAAIVSRTLSPLVRKHKRKLARREARRANRDG
jgi:glycosyltransferase involved in cell wall biosynthesis